EFGRTPVPNFSAGGRDHWYNGYAVAIFGNPIPQSGVAGSMNSSGNATNFFTPSDVHAAALLAAGINPFAPENFGVGDLSTPLGSTELTMMVGLRSQILGIV